LSNIVLEFKPKLTIGDQAPLSPSQLTHPVAPSIRTDGTIESITKNFQDSVSFIVSISIFGASTFAYIFGQIKDPKDIRETPQFSLQTVRTILSLAWLSFVLCLVVAGYSISFLKLIAKSNNSNLDHKIWRALGIAVWCLLYGLIVIAFLFLSLVLVAYVGAVGWVTLGFVGLAGVLSVTLMILQSR
jgi:hypothetical protein